jgi:hypothetical protein
VATAFERNLAHVLPHIAYVVSRPTRRARARGDDDDDDHDHDDHDDDDYDDD